MTQAAEFGYRVLNPATGDLLEHFAAATDDDVAATLAEAHEAYEDWRARPMAEMGWRYASGNR